MFCCVAFRSVYVRYTSFKRLAGPVSYTHLDVYKRQSIGRLREDSQYDYKFVCMSHNTLRGAAGGAVLMAELLCAEGYMD